MRIRTIVAAVGAAALLAGLTATPASAGTGSSTWCSDGIGYREVPILTSPVTVGVEVAHPPGSNEQYVLICYSTSAVGQPASITSGAIALHVVRDTGTGYPGAYVGVGCYPDFATGLGPVCAFANSVNVAPGDVGVSTPPSSICLVSLGSGCVAYVPGVKLTTAADPHPLLAIQVLSITVNVNPPAQCIAVVVTCT